MRLIGAFIGGTDCAPRFIDRISYALSRLALCFFLSNFAITAAADAKSDYLIRLLEGSSQFRVRAQAAISLGRIPKESAVVEALTQALNDSHPAVRAACATSLARLGDPSALSELEKHRNDAEPAVKLAVSRAIASLERALVGSSKTATTTSTRPGPSVGPSRFYVGVGLPASKSNIVKKEILLRTQKFIEEHVSSFDGVRIAPMNENSVRAKSVLRRDKLKGFFLDSSVVQVEKRPGGGTRAVVSIIVGTYPGREMRSILQGAATVMGDGPGTEVQAIEGAFRGALRRLPQALETASN